ncbi:hypothetical protein F4560_006811 [Saccharothrix ecbatanensis]|uniref:Uncharacterized protein n=1 Tax=Saccharothrix ecbatanensis TaxID=1105145 RepID=A0A7W9M4I2_9PSEU|nr:hypothetical protein [Saccharothrix ecbatanensis]MBB5807043.1 hypothetical protein [Saccharothrix ecbatanensis]
MCRAGGRRCKGGKTSSRATQRTRKAVSRARKHLRNATATGDQAAIDTARQRLAEARDAHEKAKNTMGHNDIPDQPGDVTPDATTGQSSTQDTGTQDQGDAFNQVGTVHGNVYTYGDVVNIGDTTRINIRTGTGRATTPTGKDTDRAKRRSERSTRRADRDPDSVHHGDLDQRRSTYHVGRSQSFTVPDVDSATGNATVDSQADVTHRPADTHPAAGSTGDVTGNVDRDVRPTPAKAASPSRGEGLHEAAQADLRARMRRTRARKRATGNDTSDD